MRFCITFAGGHGCGGMRDGLKRDGAAAAGTEAPDAPHGREEYGGAAETAEREVRKSNEPK